MPSPARACLECRNRKLKCDHVRPMCSTCRRSRKICDYQTTHRTPLTRSYVNQIEQELAEARAFLQENGSRMSNGPGSTPGDAVGDAAGHLESEPHLHASRSRSPGIRSRAYHLEPSGQESTIRCVLMPPEDGPPSFTFEWDERRDAVNSVTSNTHSTNDSARGGYFGIASTKAFLRIIGVREDEYHHPVHHQTPLTSSCEKQLSLLGEHIDAYFALCHPSYPIIHEATFRAQMMELVARPSETIWKMLLYTVAALGAFAISTESERSDMALFDVAKAQFSHEIMEMGNMSLVQALLLMSIYLRKRYNLNSSYNYLGFANRAAMGIGLYKEFHSSTSEPFFRETRRRLWWCLYNLNLEVSIAYSRPQDLPQREIEAHYPLNIHDLDLNPNTSSVTAEANNSTLYSSLKFGAAFYFAISSIYPRIISGPYPYAKELLLFDDSTISAWETSLPSFFRTNVPQPPNYVFCHAILHWRCLNFRILMYRPFVVWLFIMRYRNNPPKEPRDPASVNTAITRCMKAAEESISTISDFWNSHTQNALTGWYALDFIFTAVLIPAMCLRYDPGSAQAPSWNLQVRKAVRVIESITLFNSSASHGLRIIESLYKDPDSQENEHDALASNSAETHLQDSIPHPTTGVEDFFPSTPDIFQNYHIWDHFDAFAER